MIKWLDRVHDLIASLDRPQKPQIRTFEPLSPSAIALGKKPYLGPKRPRPPKRKKS